MSYVKMYVNMYGIMVITSHIPGPDVDVVITSHIPGPDVNVFESDMPYLGFVACACDGDVHSRGADSWTQTDAGHRS